MAERRKAGLGSLAAMAIVAVLIVLGGRWYYYVAFAEDPFDEVGIGLNSMMPGPVNEWGCAMLKQRFEKTTIPPMGCGQGVRW
jgi:hypothetical protein